jgi:hypothetical protein
MSKINNYDDLVHEKKRLEADLDRYKEIMSDEVSIMKHKIEPYTNVVSLFSPTKNSNNNTLLQAGTNLGIELFVRQKLLSKAGWFTKLVVPFLLKKISTAAIGSVQEIRQ